MNSTQRLSILLILSLITSTLTVNWQGTGNMTDSNMTEISTTINRFPITSTSTNDQIDDVGKNISDYLNGLWAPAWNVMISKTQLPFDTVLYGYAFRSHWMWINGIPIPTTTKTLAYVIWKDYNCQHWATIASIKASASTFTSAQTQLIANKKAEILTGSLVSTNIWLSAYNFMTAVQSDPLMSSGAYSIVFSDYYTSTARGYVCLVNNNYQSAQFITSVDSNYYGSFFLFQTR